MDSKEILKLMGKLVATVILAGWSLTAAAHGSVCTSGPHQQGTWCYEVHNSDTRNCNYFGFGAASGSNSGGGGSGNNSIGYSGPPEACQSGGGTPSVPAPPYIPPVEVILPGTVSTYYHNDPLGSPLAATDGDGNLVWKEDYRPYGARVRNQQAAEANYQWFTGKPHEEELGLSYFGARWYDPVTVRFMGIDPVGVDPGNIHSFNRYAYANNNPYRFIDPDGRASMLSYLRRGLSMEQATAVGDMGNSALKTGVGATVGAVVVGADVASDVANPVKGLSKLALKKIIKSGGNEGTETVQRWMSKAELKATKETEPLRGGREGTHYVTDAANSSAKRARQRLALEQTPEVRVTLEVPSGRFGPSSKVKPKYNMPGGGGERTATGNVPVKIKKVD